MLSEAAYALINIISMYNDHLIASSVSEKPVETEGGVLSASRWALTCLASIDVVLEMVGSLTGGNEGRWKMV